MPGAQFPSTPCWTGSIAASSCANSRAVKPAPAQHNRKSTTSASDDPSRGPTSRIASNQSPTASSLRSAFRDTALQQILGERAWKIDAFRDGGGRRFGQHGHVLQREIAEKLLGDTGVGDFHSGAAAPCFRFPRASELRCATCEFSFFEIGPIGPIGPISTRAIYRCC